MESRLGLIHFLQAFSALQDKIDASNLSFETNANTDLHVWVVQNSMSDATVFVKN